MILKSLSSLIPELQINITRSVDADTDDVKLSIGHWYLV